MLPQLREALARRAYLEAEKPLLQLQLTVVLFPRLAISSVSLKTTSSWSAMVLTDGTRERLNPVEKALKESLLPSEFRDVHLYAFTRRTLFPDGTVRIDRPLPIVAIGTILKDKSDHFSRREYHLPCARDVRRA